MRPVLKRLFDAHRDGVIVLGLGLVLPFAASAASVNDSARLDLEGAIALALESNLTLSLQALGPANARLTVEGAESEFAFRMTPELSTESVDGEDATTYGLSASRRFRAGTGISARATRSEISGELPDREEWFVEVSQPLLRRFGPLVNEEPVVSANRALEAAERSLHRQEADLVLDVVTTYETILRLERQVEADRKSLERTELLVKVTEAKERLGRTTRIDTLRVSLQLGENENRLQNTREQLELARRDLAVLLGADPETRFELTSTPRLDLELPTMEEAIRIAFENRLDYAQALRDAQDSSRRVRIARRELLPDLRATVRYEERDSLSTVGEDEGVVLVGLRTSREVLGPERRIAVSRALLDETSAERRIEITEQLIARDVQKAWLTFRRSRSELEILERNLEHAESRLRLADKMFRAGRGDNFTVVDAEESVVRAESRLLDGRAAVAIDGYRLLRALGTLVEVPAQLKPGRLAL